MPFEGTEYPVLGRGWANEPMNHCRSLSALVLLALAASAAAAHSASDGLRCTVDRAERLPADVGGAAGMCRLFEEAAAAAKARPAAVAVTVLSSAALAATVTASDGRELPEHRLVRSDRPLSRAAIERFARAVMAEPGGPARRK